MGAILSPCGRYRYALTREWGDDTKLGFIMLNPSTADAEVDDPTIRRCTGFARDAGYSGIVVGNLFAWRATAAAEIENVPDPIGPGNDVALTGIICEAPVIVCAWGNGGLFQRRGETVLEMIRSAGKTPHCLRTNASGQPAHPLYLPNSLRPAPFRGFKICG